MTANIHRVVPAVCLLVLVSCSSERQAARRPADLRAWSISEPVNKPDFTLMSMGGDQFDFREETDGLVTLLFFGYSYCPDICPLHLASIGAVLKSLPVDVASQVTVVFVTTDPERDTADRLKEWLGNFHPRFVGLRGTLDEANAIQVSLGLSPSFREESPDGDYGMAHAAQVLAFTSDNLAHVMYAFGTRQEDWAHDIPILVQGPPTGQ